MLSLNFPRYRKLFLLILVALASGAIGTLPSKELCLTLFEHVSYYFLLILFLLWALRLATCLTERWPGLLRRHCPALILSMLLMVLVFLAAPPRFKVLADEANLIGVSLMMHLDKAAALPVEGLFDDSFKPQFVTQMDKRPVLYPFLVSGLHALSGYRPQNGFVLNFIAGFGVLIAGYFTVLRFLPKPYAMAAIMLMASAPCFVIYSTSGGFETLNLLFILLTFLALIYCLDTGAGVAETEVLFLTLLLLAQCRYESIIFIPIVGLALVRFLLKKDFFQDASWLTCGTPVFLIPILWQRKGFAGTLEMLVSKVEHETLEAAEQLFSFKSLFQNIDDNLFVLLGLDPDYGFTPFLALLAVVGIYLLIRRAVLKRGDETGTILVAVAAASFVGLLTLISSNHWGLFTLPMTNRFAMVFLPYLVGGAVFGACSICQALKMRSSVALLVVLGAHLVFFWPYGSQQRIANFMALPYEYQQAAELIGQRYKKNGSTVILAEQPNLYLIQGYSAFRLSSAGRMIETLSEIAPSSTILALQKVDLRTGALQKDSLLEAPFELQLVQTIAVTRDLGLRVSECRLKSR